MILNWYVFYFETDVKLLKHLLYGNCLKYSTFQGLINSEPKSFIIKFFRLYVWEFTILENQNETGLNYRVAIKHFTEFKGLLKLDIVRMNYVYGMPYES